VSGNGHERHYRPRHARQRVTGFGHKSQHNAPAKPELESQHITAGAHSPSRGFPRDSYSPSETKIRYSYNTTLRDIWLVTCDMLTTLVQICYIGMQWQPWSIDGRLEITVHETADDLQSNKQEPTATPHEDRV
jgi:hypothetical protein